ncbi:MAG: HEAT repeat domain-containing protein [Thermodesulfobacteriota bacterium]
MEEKRTDSGNEIEKKGLKKASAEKSGEGADLLEEAFAEDGFKETKALIQTFLQTVKGSRLYESNHPILNKFLDRLKKDFDRYFQEFDSFSLQVRERQLFYQGKVVYESQEIKDNLAFLFFKDGVREIQFLKGVDIQEVHNFLSVVRRSDTINRMEDDLVTLLWEKDFSHITFTTADEFLEEGSTLVPATEEDILSGMEYKDVEGRGASESSEEEEQSERASILEAEKLHQAMNLSQGQSLTQACQLNSEELQKINQEVQEEQHPDYVFLLIEDLIEILLHLGEDIEAYENMISYFERTVDSLLRGGEVGRTVKILKDLSQVIESMALKDKQIFAVRRILETSSGPPFVESLGKAMKSDREATSEPILQYLRLLTERAVDPLCLMLEKLESPKWRQVVCDQVVDLSRSNIQPLIKLLSKQGSFLICHILYMLEKIGDPSAVKYLDNLAVHRDPKVRAETLNMIGKFPNDGKKLAQRFLKDRLPEIRAKASLLYARIAKEEAADPLIRLILSEDFHKRDYNEKASFLRALGETGSKEAIPILEKIAKKRKWFHGEKWREMGICAANILKVMETKEKPDRMRTEAN